jgi:hypothetical protein
LGVALFRSGHCAGSFVDDALAVSVVAPLLVALHHYFLGVLHVIHIQEGLEGTGCFFTIVTFNVVFGIWSYFKRLGLFFYLILSFDEGSICEELDHPLGVS